jgi:hypothetical protein
MRLSIGYSDSEDRIWIRTEASNTLWWVTRRLALRLIEQWALLLERSLADAEAGGSPEDDERAKAAARARALARTHGRAVEQARAAKVAPVERPPAGVELVNCLLASVDLSAKGGTVRLALKAPGRTEPLAMSRDEAHRFLDALLARCRRSGWYDAKLPGWLSAPE